MLKTHWLLHLSVPLLLAGLALTLLDGYTPPGAFLTSAGAVAFISFFDIQIMSRVEERGVKVRPYLRLSILLYVISLLMEFASFVLSYAATSSESISSAIGVLGAFVFVSGLIVQTGALFAARPLSTKRSG